MVKFYTRYDTHRSIHLNIVIREDIVFTKSTCYDDACYLKHLPIILCDLPWTKPQIHWVDVTYGRLSSDRRRRFYVHQGGSRGDSNSIVDGRLVVRTSFPIQHTSTLCWITRSTSDPRVSRSPALQKIRITHPLHAGYSLCMMADFQNGLSNISCFYGQFFCTFCNDL